MSEDAMDMSMVNNAGKYKAAEARHRNAQRRRFWMTARRALAWILIGVVLILLMCLDQMAAWLAASCACVCLVAAAIVVDRFVRGGRYG